MGADEEGETLGVDSFPFLNIFKRLYFDGVLSSMTGRELTAGDEGIAGRGSIGYHLQDLFHEKLDVLQCLRKRNSGV
jgi:hypothetical protein